MAGSRQGGLRAASTNKTRYGADFYKVVDSAGGRHTGRKGFAIDNRTWFQRLLRKPKRQVIAGRKGGTVSRRGPKK